VLEGGFVDPDLDCFTVTNVNNKL